MAWIRMGGIIGNYSRGAAGFHPGLSFDVRPARCAYRAELHFSDHHVGIARLPAYHHGARTGYRQVGRYVRAQEPVQRGFRRFYAWVAAVGPLSTGFSRLGP